jgi:hypothetical protein
MKEGRKKETNLKETIQRRRRSDGERNERQKK